MVDGLIKKEARDTDEVRKLLQLVNDRPNFFELLGGEDGLKRMIAGTARARIEDIVLVTATPAQSTKVITLADRMAPVRAMILPPDRQIAAWSRANRKFGRYKIPKYAFRAVEALSVPNLTFADMAEGYVGGILCYGFGGKGKVSDMVLSGKVPWEYIASQRATWKWSQVNFDDRRSLREFIGKHSERPVGFYWKLIQLGHAFQSKPVASARDLIMSTDWGMGPEGIQFFLTHPHYAEQMDGTTNPFMDLSDYEVSFDGVGVFSSAPCVSFNRGGGELELNSGNVSHPLPNYGSGSLR
ncbi:MAG: hypothetical protein ABIJ23_03625 [Candidatus Magasanikbacteria bacterium]